MLGWDVLITLGLDVDFIWILFFVYLIIKFDT